MATWDTMRRQVVAALSFGLSGHPYWTQDIGAFVRLPSSVTDVGYHELLVRWLQFGIFSPVTRTHGTGAPTELWEFGDVVLDRAKDILRFRYQMRPYIYSCFARAARWDLGYTVMRALQFDFDYEDVEGITDQYMFGPSVLVAPILSPGGSRKVLLPRRIGGWVNFVTNEFISTDGGAQVIDVKQEWGERYQAPPIFVKGGGGIFVWDNRGDVKYSTKHRTGVKDLMVEVYGYPQSGADEEPPFRMYEDDGETKDGPYATFDMSVTARGTFVVTKRSYVDVAAERVQVEEQVQIDVTYHDEDGRTLLAPIVYRGDAVEISLPMRSDTIIFA